jgi:hypothetical protein
MLGSKVIDPMAENWVVVELELVVERLTTLVLVAPAAWSSSGMADRR